MQDATEVLLRFTVAVLHRGVEVVHTGGDSPRNGPLLIERIAAHHQPADRTAAEAEHGKLQAGAAEDPRFHGCFLDYSG